VGEVGVVEVGEGAKGSAILVDLAILALLHRAAEHLINIQSMDHL
jgi:hypothetical protein